MKLRFWLNLSGLIGTSILAGYMMRQEVVEAKEEKKEVSYVDTFVNNGGEYTKSQRKDNFAYFGMTKPMIKRAEMMLKRWDEQESKIQELLKEAYQKDPEGIEKAFCAKNPNERPRYQAITYLVTRSKDFEYDIINLKKKLKKQGWSETIDIEDVYKLLELRENPKENTTVMYAAAIFSDQIDTVIDESYPWGQASNWSWDDVVKQNEDKLVENKVTDYLSLMHIFTEIALDSNSSICNSQ